MLSYRSTEIRSDDAGHDRVEMAALGGTGRTATTRRIIGLTAELAAELSRFQVTDLGSADVHGLMHGMNRTAGALTRILDQLCDCPELTHGDNELVLSRRTVRSELEQAAAAAEDLQAAAESLCRRLPAEPSR